MPWAREGLFKFTFEVGPVFIHRLPDADRTRLRPQIKSTDRKYTFKAMEATDHAFSHEARNWGWAQYWRRNDAYYNNQQVQPFFWVSRNRVTEIVGQAKYHDSFLICCTIVYSCVPSDISITSSALLKKVVAAPLPLRRPHR